MLPDLSGIDWLKTSNRISILGEALYSLEYFSPLDVDRIMCTSIEMVFFTRRLK